MRSNQESSNMDGVRMVSGKLGSARRALIGDITLTANDPLIYFLDAGGVDRNITLFAVSGGNFRVLSNVGTAGNLVVKTPAAVTLTTIAPGETAQLFGSLAEWTASKAAAVSPATGATPVSANYTALPSDNDGFIIGTGTWTLALTAAATLGSRWKLKFKNNGTGRILIDPNGAETIDGVASITVYPGESFEIRCDGTSFHSVGRGNSSWIAYVPATIVAQTPGGTPPVFTDNGISFYMISKGETVTLSGDFSVTSQGTGSGSIIVADPTELPNSSAGPLATGSAWESAVTGKSGTAFHNLSAHTTTVAGSRTDAGGTALIITGYRVSFTISYKIPLQ